MNGVARVSKDLGILVWPRVLEELLLARENDQHLALAKRETEADVLFSYFRSLIRATTGQNCLWRAVHAST